jgi:tRNA A-37 threonylcarbamoyl transferase component Bud32
MDPLAFRHALLLVAGRWLARLRLHDVAVVSNGEGRFVIKRRRWWTGPTVWLGNWLLRGDRVRVLQLHDWREREQAMHHGVHGEGLRCDSGGNLFLPCCPGRTLSDWLTDPTVSIESRLNFVRDSARSLAALHSLLDDVTGRSLSHGDATVRNVIVDANTSRATWIDFDTAHIMASRAVPNDEAWRTTDDLRALICSAAVLWPVDSYAALVRALADGYGECEAMSRLAARVAESLRRPRLFHLAQAPLPRTRLAVLADELAKRTSLSDR